MLRGRHADERRGSQVFFRPAQPAWRRTSSLLTKIAQMGSTMAWKPLLGLAPFFLSVSLAITAVLLYRLLAKRRERRSPLASRQIGHVPG